ncbi:MAG: response regulator [Cyanobacteria bacterium SZAS-4]|nr:response regulator [Cyanobacteria bacterium SZAS-4]
MDEPEIELGTIKLAPKDTFRILIMDTEAHTEQLKKVCKGMGHNVIAAHTITEAFAFLDGRDHADVIVCAAYMEDESMFEFLRRLRKDPVHKKTMFMIMALEPGPFATKLNASVESAGKALGADVFISMPVFDAAQLIAEIEKLLPLVPALEKSRLAKESKAI